MFASIREFFETTVDMVRMAYHDVLDENGRSALAAAMKCVRETSLGDYQNA